MSAHAPRTPSEAVGPVLPVPGQERQDSPWEPINEPLPYRFLNWLGFEARFLSRSSLCLPPHTLRPRLIVCADSQHLGSNYCQLSLPHRLGGPKAISPRRRMLVLPFTTSISIREVRPLAILTCAAHHIAFSAPTWQFTMASSK